MKNDEQNSRKEYLNERELLIKTENEMSKSFDKAMITLSAGALALSITFIDKLVASIIAGRVYLILSWIGFVVALLSILISFLLSQSAFRKQREILDQKQREILDHVYAGEGNQSRNCYSIITNWLNIISVCFFIFGTITLVIFCSINL